MKFSGVIFDMDGLLLDTEKLYTRFWTQAARDCGYPMEQKHALSIRSLNSAATTKKLKEFFGELFEYRPVYDRRVELMEKFIEENGVETKKGAEELLLYLKENGYKTALATSSPYERAKAQLSSVGLYKYFDEFACGPMVEKSKPEPDIYLLAAKKLRLSPEVCLALEDSPSGIRSAYRAGCKAVMVPDLDRPDEELQKLLYACCDSLSDVIDLLKQAASI